MATEEQIKRLMQEREQRDRELYEKVIGDFPFERIEIAGDKALTAWAELKLAGRGIPVVLGGDDSMISLIGAFTLHPRESAPKSVGDILEAAAQLRHPEDLAKKRSADTTAARESIRRHIESAPDAPLPTIIQMDASSGEQRQLSREETLASMLSEHEPQLGEWPSLPPESAELSVAFDILSGKPRQRVHIALIPTDDWTTVPAYLRWGGWNDCPHPEYHVAALRSWRDRFGAELIGLSFDTMNLRVKRGPETRDAAVELAREQYLYCTDIVDQGVETLRNLAAGLLAHRWWYFWWD
jgi:hypothetical protein